MEWVCWRRSRGCGRAALAPKPGLDIICDHPKSRGQHSLDIVQGPPQIHLKFLLNWCLKKQRRPRVPRRSRKYPIGHDTVASPRLPEIEISHGNFQSARMLLGKLLHGGDTKLWALGGIGVGQHRWLLRLEGLPDHNVPGSQPLPQDRVPANPSGCRIFLRNLFETKPSFVVRLGRLAAVRQRCNLLGINKRLQATLHPSLRKHDTHLLLDEGREEPKGD
mmetsp:Transcript_132518/g.301248  ORF Transcript_132518/g.301248 Transcript_132518/m.301248 type:complete len:220 (-) Transcript_132518:733-1392(-)